MSLGEDLKEEVKTIFASQWTTREGQVVPKDDDLKLGNDAVKLNATVLYADLADSTKLVDNYKPWFAAEIYKAFLLCAAKIIRSEGGEITAYDGDRVMAVFIGDSKNTAAVRAGMKIHYAVAKIITPAMKAQLPKVTYVLKHVVGVDTSDLYVARTGVRGANDLVWVGRAANYAAKLCANPETYQTYITKDVYDVMHSSVKVSEGDELMWDTVTWDQFDMRTIYGSRWWWRVA